MVSPQGVHHSSDAKSCSRHHAAKEQWSNRPQLNRKDNANRMQNNKRA